MIGSSLRRIGRFAVVGVLGTLLDFGLFTLLHATVGIPALAANTVSYSVGIVNNFICHRAWTYGDRSRRVVGPQFAQFLVVSLTALGMNNLVVLALGPTMASLVASDTLGAVLAKVVATGVATCFSYIANTYWTFSRVQ